MKFAIISVGNELLRGDISNDNAKYIAKRLTEIGHSVERIVVVPDVIEDIADEVKRLLSYDFIFITGGLGPTHDDVTAEAIAFALKRKMIIDEKAVKQIKKWTNNKDVVEKVARVPEGSEIIENDVGVAPAFVVDKIAVMPGVPAEMRNTFEKIIRRFETSEFYIEELKIQGLEERVLKELNTVVELFPDVDIGSYPKKGYVIIKFSGRNKEKIKKAKEKLLELVEKK